MPTGVYERTKKIRIAIGNARRGRKFSSLSPRHRRRISKALKGKRRSKETRAKLSKIMKGKRRSPKTEFKKGNPKPRNAYSFPKGCAHPNWKNGRTPLQQQIRTCFKYRLWRSDIFTRDDFACQLCGIRGGFLEVDHYPKSFAEILDIENIQNLEEALNCEELWNINNGRTVHRQCHPKDGKKWSKATIKEALKEHAE